MMNAVNFMALIKCLCVLMLQRWRRAAWLRGYVRPTDSCCPFHRVSSVSDWPVEVIQPTPLMSDSLERKSMELVRKTTNVFM